MTAPEGAFETCDHCGHELHEACPQCGAPVCCPVCCNETTRELEASIGRNLTPPLVEWIMEGRSA